MRVIGINKLNAVGGKQGKAKQAFLAWYYEAKNAGWNSFRQIKSLYTGAVPIKAKRIAFPIYGNSYQLVADINYDLQILNIVWFGTKKQFEETDLKKI